MLNIDETDIKLLNHLQNDCNITTKELAQNVHLSSTPVFERIKRLENEGFIKKYVAVLDADKLEKDFMVFCNVKLKQHNKEIGFHFINDIMEIKEITECYNISGDFDFMLKVFVTNMKQYQNFVLNKLGTIDCIDSIQSIFVMSEIKNTYALPL